MNEERDSSEQAVRELIQEAGKRPPIPAADLAIIKASARHEWQRMQEAEGNRERPWFSQRLLAMAAVLVVAVLAGWWWNQRGGQEAGLVVATVEISNQQSAAFPVGSEIVSGTRIDTPSPMAIRLVSGQSLRVAADTSLELVSSSKVRLSHGAVYVDSGLSVAGQGIRIRTDYGVVREVGTQFEVSIGSVEQPLRIRVREGEVVMKSNGLSSSAAAGVELTLQRDGSVQRDRVALFGDAWEWTEELAPPFSMDESSFAAYLEWLTRETGWQIEFEDAELRRSASEIVLYGSLEDASPRESLDLAFPGTGLSYRLEGGTLRILRI